MAIRSRRWFGIRAEHQPGRFTIMLGAILLMILSQPFLVGYWLAESLLTLTIAVVLVSALYAFRRQKTYLILGAVLLVPAFSARIAIQFTASVTLDVVGAVFSSLFLLVTVTALIRQLFRTHRVTFDTISAAICAYLLMGVAWGFVFAVIDMQHPGAFTTGLHPEATPPSGSALMRTLHTFLYYSFVCLTTTGYGDITPLTGPARVFSIIESIFGQLYLAILISRLVSLEVAQSMTGDR